MRASRAIAVALVVLVLAALATLWQAPPVAAASGQSGSQIEQAGKPNVEKQAGSNPRIITHAIQAEPLIAALAGGGPRLGVQIRDLAKEDLAKFKLSTTNGVVIDEVMKDSAAERAGVKAGDVVVQFDGENVRSAAQLTRLVRETVAGRSVKMGMVRDGKRLDLEVVPAAAAETFDIALGGDRMADLEKRLQDVQEKVQQFRFERRVPAPDRPMPPGSTLRWRQQAPLVPLPEGDVMQWFGDDATGNFVFSMGRGRLGVTVQELTPELAAYFGVKSGLLVSAVQADSPAAKAGIKAGDVIGSVNGKDVATPADLIRELADKEGEVAVGLTRDKKPMSLKASLEPRKAPARRIPAAGRPA